MKNVFIILVLLLSVNTRATTVKLKITYNNEPVSDCDVTIKHGDAALGKGRTNSSGEVSISASGLISKSIDVYGEKTTSNGKKTWSAKGYVTLDNSNYAHLKMEELVKEMASASGMSESMIAGMWGLVVSGDNKAEAPKQAKTAATTAGDDEEDDDNKKKPGSGFKKLASMGDGIKVTTETHTSSSKSGPDGSSSSSSSSKSETKIGGGKVDHSSSSSKSNTTFGDDGFNQKVTEKNNGGSFNMPSGKKTTGTGKSDQAGVSAQKETDNTPAVDPEVEQAERKKQKHEGEIEKLDKEIISLNADLMQLRSEKDPDTITIRYKSADLETVQLKKEREQIGIDKANAKIAKTDLSREKQDAFLKREAEIEFRLKQLEELEKASKEDRRNEEKRREARKEALEDQKKEEAKLAKEAEKEAREEANFDTYSKSDLKLRLVDLKSKLGMQHANAKTTINKEKRAEYEKEITLLKAKIERYEKRIAELEAKEAGEKKKD